MTKNYALELLEENEALLKEYLAAVKDAITKLTPQTSTADVTIKNVKPVKPIKNPAAFHVTKALKDWLDEQPTLSLEALKAKFPAYKDATIKTQLYNYKRNTGREEG